jgi:4-amino-4-deoxychorismate lyase
MCRLIESIKIKDGEIVNPSFHSSRMNGSRRNLYNCADDVDVREIISVPNECMDGVHKCRIMYAIEVLDVTFEQYSRRNIRSLKLVCDDTIDYSYKFENRERLLSLLKQREHCDDILIVKNGLVTDTSFSNIAFSDGQKWITPASPLLKGTKRAHLLAMGIIKEEELTVSGIRQFNQAALINAMLELGESVLPVKNIF